jgi:hypothetical protein
MGEVSLKLLTALSMLVFWIVMSLVLVGRYQCFRWNILPSSSGLKSAYIIHLLTN